MKEFLMVLHDKELAFFIENHKELTRAGYTPEDCCLYGEIGFLMLRLKPLVLTNMPELPEITKLYIAQVLLTAYESQQSLSIIPITNTLSTQTTLLTGSYFVCLKERENEIQALVDAHNQLDDEILQSLLDYPGSLPKDDQDALENGFMEVSYIDMSDKEISTVLTSYAARPSEHDAVVAHFERYKEASSGVFNLSLVIKS